jgi:Anti-sigma-K factor rskA, C-terminal
MEHQEVRELLEDAAIEPGGLERLMAGDTPNAAIVAGHLAGCRECTEEMERLRRTVGMIRPAVRAVPPPELRQRTLDYVAALGRPRGPAVAAAGAGAVPAPQPAIAALPARRRPAIASWALGGAIAAALAVAIFGGGVLVGGNNAANSGAQAAEVEALGDVARQTMLVDGQPDARRVALASADGSSTTGSLLFSPSSKELVVVADQLVPPPAGKEYRCWVIVNGERKPIGKMFFGGDLAYWVGPVEAVAALPANSQFGVSLVDLANPGQTAPTVLVGQG